MGGHAIQTSDVNIVAALACTPATYERGPLLDAPRPWCQALKLLAALPGRPWLVVCTIARRRGRKIFFIVGCDMLRCTRQNYLAAAQVGRCTYR